MPTVVRVKGEFASTTNALNLATCVGSVADGASGNELHGPCSWRCTSRGFESPSSSKSTEGLSVWPHAPQATNRRITMTRVGAIRFTIPRSRKRQATFRLVAMRGKPRLNASTSSDTSLSKIARIPGILLIRYAKNSCAFWVATRRFGTWLDEAASESGDYSSKWSGGLSHRPAVRLCRPHYAVLITARLRVVELVTF
jgi:hypothetical protein